jgi:hypothetical protein
MGSHSSVITDKNQLNTGNVINKPELLVEMGFYYKRSGDVMLITEPDWIDETDVASTHSTGYSYDTNVPLIFYGWGINKGESMEHINITDIAPTISILLNIKLPGANIISHYVTRNLVKNTEHWKNWVK